MAVYPRVCGGTAVMTSSGIAVVGLSPRVRGNRAGRQSRCGEERSIPACAGEPSGAAARSRRGTVYPRVCGGTGHSLTLTMGDRGISPRVRGNPLLLCPSGFGEGSIPACAGEPAARATMTRVAEVYPRVCGGTDWMVFERRSNAGLSPRVRGNQADVSVEVVVDRSIPACAGEPP